MDPQKEKLIYFVMLIALCFIIIIDSTFELSKNTTEEESKSIKPIVISNLIISILFLLISNAFFIFK